MALSGYRDYRVQSDFFYMRGTHERLCLKLNQKVLKGEYEV